MISAQCHCMSSLGYSNWMVHNIGIFTNCKPSTCTSSENHKHQIHICCHQFWTSPNKATVLKTRRNNGSLMAVGKSRHSQKNPQSWNYIYFLRVYINIDSFWPHSFTMISAFTNPESALPLFPRQVSSGCVKGLISKGEEVVLRWFSNRSKKN